MSRSAGERQLAASSMSVAQNGGVGRHCSPLVARWREGESSRRELGLYDSPMSATLPAPWRLLLTIRTDA